MEANFFRHLAVEAGERLRHRRIEKIYAPGDSAWTFRVDGREEDKFLLFRPAKSAGLFFFSTAKPINPMTAPARAMWFRKRVAGRRVLDYHVDWPNLRLALELTPTQRDTAGRFLLFDVRNGLRLLDELDDGFGQSPEWPSLDLLLEESDIWREYPQVSPPLRRRLASLDPEDAQQLYFQLIQGDIPLRFHVPKTTKGLSLPLAWPAPGENLSFTTALAAAATWGERELFADLEMETEHPELVQLKRARKKVKRALKKLEQEQDRLNRLQDGRILAEALQANLYQLHGEQPDVVTVEHPEHGAVEIPLDPQLTPVENMERLFTKADKARRGFIHLARRRNELGKELASLEAGQLPLEEATRRKGPAKEVVIPKRYRGLAVSLFVTDDGLLAIRGKNKQANHAMLSKAASPFDFWFHAVQGSSSHVILRRDHPNQEVPTRSLEQAASLCGLKSRHRDAGRAEIMRALVKDVRKVKGYAHGQVAVDKIEETHFVEWDNDLETRLAFRGKCAEDD